MKPYFDEARFYQGASQPIPLTIPTENYLQGIVTGADRQPTLQHPRRRLGAPRPAPVTPRTTKD